ncbi:MAG: alpha-glucan family phosphorylase [Chloroflexota bacterium]|nr:alpha-glucan family phosphorylase [Chloroflexota bacterium]
MDITNHNDLRLPERIERLEPLAYNLWWSWNPEARYLFRRIDQFVWERVGENPVLFLHTVDPERLKWASFDAEFLKAYDRVMSSFDSYLDPGASTWVSEFAPELHSSCVAYFSAEFGLYRSLPIYSGGLGVLAGDHIKEASDLGLPLVAVTLLYRTGYLSQRLTADGWQQDVTPNLEPHSEPTTQMRDENGEPILIDLALDNPDAPIKLAIWKVRVGRVDLLLLDSDVEGNPEWTRNVSSRLYGGDREHRLRQELILGIGGVRALRALGYEPGYWHANEGHAAFSLLERLREMVADGIAFDDACKRVAANTVFTTHTPVPAGHDHFSPELMDRYFGHFWPQLAIDRDRFFDLGHFEETGADFNMTALSMRLADHRNGVSKKHGEVTREMWKGIWPDTDVENVPVRSVTNGVHLQTWIAPRIARMLDAHIGPEWRELQADPEVWKGVRGIPDDVFWRAHSGRKRRLLDVLSERSRQRWVGGGDSSQVLSGGPFLEEKVLTIGFARRFATYKRATLLFHDADRLASILTNQDRPVQIVFAGKAHPADDGGKHMIRELIWRARDPKFGGRIAFAEDYDMGVASLLVSGVDVWLNNPQSPMEASGTSGMKAAANGVPNLSILDGWWIEGWAKDNSNGWGIEGSAATGWEQDHADANAIYDVIEHMVAPLYYRRDETGIPRDWLRVCKNAMMSNAPAFSARRMLMDYIEHLYSKAAQGALVSV